MANETWITISDLVLHLKRREYNGCSECESIRCPECKQTWRRHCRDCHRCEDCEHENTCPVDITLKRAQEIIDA